MKSREESAGAAREAKVRGSRLGTFLKWIGAVTAVISFALGFAQLLQLFADSRERATRIREAIVDARVEEKDGSYKIAWLTLADAAKIADDGGNWARLFGRLDAPRRELNAAREDVAMGWLRHARLRENESWREFADQFLPLLVHGATNAKGVRKADLFAHIGWAYFLEEKESSRSVDPAPQYKQALALDAQNCYAHTFWGHWILWNHGSLAEAQKHFDAAAASGRARPFVRQIEFAAYHDLNNPEGDAGVIRVAAAMQKDHEDFNSDATEMVWNVYAKSFRDQEASDQLIAAVPPREQIALIERLFVRPNFGADRIPIRENYLASLEEAAGEKKEALARWRALRPTLTPNIWDDLLARADAAIQRLSQP